jgi:hypothetical protein
VTAPSQCVKLPLRMIRIGGASCIASTQLSVTRTSRFGRAFLPTHIVQISGASVDTLACCFAQHYALDKIAQSSAVYRLNIPTGISSWQVTKWIFFTAQRPRLRLTTSASLTTRFRAFQIICLVKQQSRTSRPVSYTRIRRSNESVSSRFEARAIAD